MTELERYKKALEKISQYGIKPTGETELQRIKRLKSIADKALFIASVSHPLPSWYKKLDLLGMQLEALQEDIPKNLKLRSNAKLDLELIDMRLTAMRSKLKLALDELKGNCG